MNSKQYVDCWRLWSEPRRPPWGGNRRAVCEVCGHREAVRGEGNAFGQVARLRAKIAAHVRAAHPEHLTREGGRLPGEAPTATDNG